MNSFGCFVVTTQLVKCILPNKLLNRNNLESHYSSDHFLNVLKPQDLKLI